MGGLLAESLGSSANFGVITLHHSLDSLEVIESNSLVHRFGWRVVFGVGLKILVVGILGAENVIGSLVAERFFESHLVELGLNFSLLLLLFLELLFGLSHPSVDASL